MLILKIKLPIDMKELVLGIPFDGSEKQMTLHHRLNRDVLKTKSCQNLSMLNK